MPKMLGTLGLVCGLASQPSIAQTRQLANDLYLICRVQIVMVGVANYGQIYDETFHVTFNPPQIFVRDLPPSKALINENEIKWQGGVINRVTGFFSDAGSRGKCEQTSTQRRF